MASPTYNTDLSTICLMETGDTFEEFSGYKLGDNASLETDWYIQGSSCASDENNNKTGVGHSIGFDYGSSVTFSTGDCFFVWMYYLLPNAVDTFANGGYRVLIGNTISDFKGWKVGGSDFTPNPYGGWTNVAVDPTYTADYTSGTPDGTYRHFAAAYKCVSGTLKGRPVCADAMRYGRGELYVEYGDGTNGYATFSGMASSNDAQTARWGLFQKIAGGYLWKGLMSLGTTTNAVDFRDSNVSITVDDTPRTYASFNKIEINNVSSRIDWTGVSIISVNSSGLSLGSFEVVDNADVNFDTCTFTDMNTFIFQSNSTIIDTTFRRCAQVTQGGAVIDGCVFEKSTDAVALLVSNLNNIDNCSFVSDGSNHAIELTSAHAGNTYTLTGCKYSGYASSDGSTGNECIYNNSGGAVTINIDGGNTPSIRNGTGASTTLVINPVTTKITVKDLITGSAINGARVLLMVSDSTNYPYQDTVSITSSGTTATVSHTAHGMATNDHIIINGANEDAYNGVYQITVTDANTYTYTMTATAASPATGTITATFAVISGTTDVNGEISDTRSWSSNQNVTGWARKSTSSPYYQQGNITGTISSSSGLNVTIQLVRDE